MDISGVVVGDEQVLWEQYLKTLFKLSRIICHEESGLPTFKIDSNSDLLNKLYDVIQASIEISKTKHLQYYCQVWKLYRILWGLKDVPVSEKRELLSTWLSWDLVPPTVECEPVTTKNSVLLKLFKYYLSNEVSSASQHACENNYPALSLLMAQKQSSAMKHLVAQYNRWASHSMLDGMDKYLLKLYMLLGRTEVIRGSNVFHDLEWKQVLALYLWYTCPKHFLIEDVVSEYSLAFTADHTATPPLPLHQEKIFVMAFDLKYRLLEFYSKLSMDLCKVLNPLGYTEHIGDYHLSWFLLLLFEMNNIGVSNENISNTITFNFAAQLEVVGLWTWAIFVLLFIKDEVIKLRAVTGILERNLGNIIEDEANNYETFLIDDLKISSDLIHSIMAYMKQDEQVDTKANFINF